LKVPWLELAMFIGMLSAPSIISGPLIYISRSNPSRIRRWLFIAAVEFHFTSFELVVIYAGSRLAYLPKDAIMQAVPFVAFGLVVTSVALYMEIKRRTIAGNERLL
jgi:hypothetical protein